MSKFSLAPALVSVALLVGCPQGQEVDLTGPTLTRTSPEEGARDVLRGSALTLTFSEPMEPGSLKVTVTPGVDLHPADWNADRTEATLVPWLTLAAGTAFTVAVEGTDVAGNALSGKRSFGFTTEEEGDIAPPTLVQSVPANNAMDVATDAVVSLTFSEPLDTESLQVDVQPALELGAPAWSAGNKTVSFPAPAMPFAAATSYELSIAAADVAGNPLEGAGLLSFTTAAGATGAPKVVSVSPPAAATGVSTNTALVLAFSKPMKQASVQAALSLQPAATLSFVWNAAGTSVTCMPAGGLAASTTYSLTLAVTAQDLTGVPLGAMFTSSFTTGSNADVTKPTVASSLPAAGAVGQSAATSLQLTFSEPMNPLSVEGALTATTPAAVVFNPGVWSADKTQVTFTPKTAPAQSTTVTWRLTTAAKDLAGNALAAEATGTWTVSKQAIAVLTSLPALDAAVNSSGGLQAPDALTSYAGDGANDVTHTLMLTFDLSKLPATTDRVVRATLYLFQASVSGTPYSASTAGTDCMTRQLGCLYVDGVDYGPTIEGTDFATPTLPTAAGTPETVYAAATTAPATKAITSTRKVQDDFEKRVARGARAQFRLRFFKPTDGDAVRDTANFYTGDYTGTCTSTIPGGGCRPTLQVVYDYH